VLQRILTIAGLFVASIATALAQNYPNKPIRIIIAQAPGSATDVISRVVGNRLQESLGQPVIIEARPGAGGAVGTEAAARSAPDGYTLFMGNNSTHGSNPALYPKLPYDAVNDFAPITLVAAVPYVLVVDPSLPVNSVEQLIALAKSRPGKMNYASAGNGSTHHFCGELLKSMAGIDLLHIPYKGSPPAIAGLLGGEVSLMFANLTDIGSQIRSGKVKALAVTVANRANLLPEVPTLSEADRRPPERGNGQGSRQGRRAIDARCAGPRARARLSRAVRGSHQERDRQVHPDRQGGRDQGGVAPLQRLMNLSTNSSFGMGGSGVFRSRGSAGFLRKFPSSASLKPAASISRRTKASSMRCNVPPSEMPVPRRPEWSATT
jgi:tripartite-type tricarboxylate transporter receptor subunit TctC